jgi:hypothetical protein
LKLCDIPCWIAAVDEAGKGGAPIGALLRASLVEPGLGAGCVVGRRQAQQGQEAPALEMRPLLLELCAPLGVREARGRVGKTALRIAVGRHPLCPDADRPTRAEAPQRVVEASRRRDQFGRGRRVEIRPAEPRGALE